MRANSASSFGSSSSFKLDDDGTKSPLEDHEDLQDYKNNLIKYGKSFSTRLIQVLVQSRTAERYSHSCSVEGPLQWFNLHLDELGEVTAFIKSLKITDFPPAVPQLSIDFFLYTCDHETLPLETWSFLVDGNDPKNGTPQCPVNTHHSAFYHQLSTLLRSAMVAARMTPLHRYYVKKQSAETFVVLYRIVSGPSTIDIGRDAKKIRLGNLSSYIGSWKLDLSYRTRMEIEPSNSHVMDGADSFQRIGSPGSTPESFKMQIGSPSSFGGISHFSTSPSTSSPIEFSPIQDNIIQSRMQASNSTPTVKPTRSRSTSLASDSEEIASESPHEMRRSVTIPKNMPFANLLILSYSGTLFPLMEGTNEQDDDNATALNTSNRTVVGKSSLLDDDMENSLEDRSRKNTIVEMKRPKDLNLKNLHTPKKSEDVDEDAKLALDKTDEHNTNAVEKERESDSDSLEETCSTPTLNSQVEERLARKETDVPSNEAQEDEPSSEENVDNTTPTPSAVILNLKTELSPDDALQDVVFKMGSSCCLKNSTEGEEQGNALAGNKKRVTVKLEPEHFEKDEQSEEASGEDVDEDDSFVKIPPFHMQFNRDEDNLASLLVDCKEPPSLSSFEPVDFSQIKEELDFLSLNQGLFDRFISEIREGNMDESP
ncbi:unnamed protein product [Auanema sp. JU1783]|nr:unnamed protein product [Auanema sp. JU1783]